MDPSVVPTLLSTRAPLESGPQRPPLPGRALPAGAAGLGPAEAVAQHSAMCESLAARMRKNTAEILAGRWRAGAPGREPAAGLGGSEDEGAVDEGPRKRRRSL